MSGPEIRGYEDVGIVELRIYLKFEMLKGREYSVKCKGFKMKIVQVFPKIGNSRSV
jgi:hypothetical protein